MTQGGDKKSRKAGYRNPPAEHQFKPGRSGNPPRAPDQDRAVADAKAKRSRYPCRDGSADAHSYS